jgi:hypothetical protein
MNVYCSFVSTVIPLTLFRLFVLSKPATCYSMKETFIRPAVWASAPGKVWGWGRGAHRIHRSPFPQGRYFRGSLTPPPPPANPPTSISNILANQTTHLKLLSVLKSGDGKNRVPKSRDRVFFFSLRWIGPIPH